MKRAIAVLIVAFTIVFAPFIGPGPAYADTYANFAALAAQETLGTDYRIRLVNRHTPLAIVAPHGGSIEPGTSELARAIAGEEVTGLDWTEYRFEGIKSSGNSILHITSTNFDEPWCDWTVANSMRVVTVHGFADDQAITYVGGLDTLVRDRVIAALTAAGFSAQAGTGSLAGTDSTNIANEGQMGKGVQIEISDDQRVLFFTINTMAGRWDSRTQAFHDFVLAVRTGMQAETVTLG